MEKPSFTVSVPAEPRFLKAVRAFFRTALRETFRDETDMVVLALDEACSNVLKHRSIGAECEGVCVQAEILGDRVRFRVKNFCNSADVAQIRPRDLDAVRPGGLGTHFVNRIMDRVRFEEEPALPGIVALVLEKALPAAPE